MSVKGDCIVFTYVTWVYMFETSIVNTHEYVLVRHPHPTKTGCEKKRNSNSSSGCCFRRRVDRLNFYCGANSFCLVSTEMRHANFLSRYVSNSIMNLCPDSDLFTPGLPIPLLENFIFLLHLIPAVLSNLSSRMKEFKQGNCIKYSLYETVDRAGLHIRQK